MHPTIAPHRPAVFLDRDGTLVRDVRHNADPARMELLPGVVEALQALQAASFRLVVVTNQSGVARGYFDPHAAAAMGEHLVARLAPAGIRLDGYYFCPHFATGAIPEWALTCDCRKPAPGMLLRAAGELGLDLARSWMVGDMPSDVGAATAAGVRPILVDIGSQSVESDAPLPALLARNLPHAAALILAAEGLVTPGQEPTRVDHDLFTPLPPSTLHRAVPPKDQRRQGEPDPFPDAAWLARAEADAAALVGATGASRGESGGSDVPIGGLGIRP